MKVWRKGTDSRSIAVLYLRREKVYKSIQHNNLTKLYESAIDAVVEEEKFIRFVHPDGWPQETATLRKRLLSTTILDKNLSENRGNTTKILSFWLFIYQLHHSSGHEGNKMKNFLQRGSGCTFGRLL